MVAGYTGKHSIHTPRCVTQLVFVGVQSMGTDGVLP